MQTARALQEDTFLADLAEQFGLDPAQVCYEARLTDDLGFDSLGRAELAFWLEQRGVRVPLEALGGIETLEDLVARSLPVWLHDRAADRGGGS